LLDFGWETALNIEYILNYWSCVIKYRRGLLQILFKIAKNVARYEQH
jgi:hypothetical protein